MFFRKCMMSNHFTIQKSGGVSQTPGCGYGFTGCRTAAAARNKIVNIFLEFGDNWNNEIF